jgi:hypothetical protein
MNLSLINFNLLNGDLMYQMMEPLKRKGIRWLALNGGIRWLALNGEVVNGGGDMRGKRHSRGGLLDF